MPIIWDAEHAEFVKRKSKTESESGFSQWKSCLFAPQNDHFWIEKLEYEDELWILVMIDRWVNCVQTLNSVAGLQVAISNTFRGLVGFWVFHRGKTNEVVGPRSDNKFIKELHLVREVGLEILGPGRHSQPEPYAGFMSGLKTLKKRVTIHNNNNKLAWFDFFKY